MPDQWTYDYAVIRVVPRVEREEFINAGIILSCPGAGFLEACIEVDAERLRALDASLDLDSIRAHLAAIPAMCAGGDKAGPIGRMSPRERFDWLVARRSTSIQTSPVHTGWCTDPAAVLNHLMDTVVRRPKAGSAPQRPR